MVASQSAACDKNSLTCGSDKGGTPPWQGVQVFSARLSGMSIIHPLSM